jgi:Predicted methyltransferase
MITKCIRVPKKDGEYARAGLMDRQLLDINFKIRSEGEFLLMPVVSDIVEGYATEEHEMEPIVHEETDYKELLDIGDELKEELPRSYDIIGDVAIIKLTDGLLEYKEEIGNALMKVTPNLRLVMLDSGVKGDLRIRDLEKISGTGDPETIHKEFGVRLLIDPAKVYFNPRLSTERARLASEVKEGETIIDMFAGVAPFGTVICKLARPKVVYSIDLNPDAEYFARKNMTMNNISEIVPITGDSREKIKELPDADRIIMNLPQMADQFILDALNRTKIGGIIHLHKVLERSDFDEFVKRLIEEVEKDGKEIRFNATSELKTYSPVMSVYVFDIVRIA